MQSTTLSAEYLEPLYGTPVPQDVLYWALRLETLGFDVVFTGSRIIGGWTDASDWDLVVACDLDDPRVLDLKHQMYRIKTSRNNPFYIPYPSDCQVGQQVLRGRRLHHHSACWRGEHHHRTPWRRLPRPLEDRDRHGD